MSHHEADVPLVSIVIVSYNRRDELKRCVEAAKAQAYPNTEIVIIDNNSTDGGCERIASEYPDVAILRMHRNLGWPMAKNIATANCRGEYLYFLDDDLYLFPDAVEEAVRLLEERPEVMIVSGQTMDVDTGEPLPLSVWRRGEQVHDERYTTAIYGGHAAWRRGVMEQVGFYPEHSVWGGLDSFVALWALDQGLIVYWTPKILGYHTHAKGGRDDAVNFAQAFRNRIYIAWRVHPLHYAVAGTVWPIFTYFVSAVRKRQLRAWFKTLLSIPLLPWRALDDGRRPIKVSTMRLHRRLAFDPPISRPEQFMAMSPATHPAHQACRKAVESPSA